MKKTAAITFSAIFCSALHANYWQSGTVETQQTAAPTSTSSNTSYSYNSGTLENRMDKIYDFDTDSMNLEDGTLNWKGKTFSMGNSRVVRARFERYLATDFDGANYENYQKILNQIASILSPNNDELSKDSVRLAWQLLYDAAEYDVDNDGCLTIANTVYNVFRMRNELKTYQISEGEAERARRATERRLDYFRNTEDKERERKFDEASPGEKQIIITREALNRDKKKEEKDLARAARASSDLASDLAKETAIAASIQTLGAKSVLQFQSQIMSFIFARRFQHATISSYFYRHLYKANNQNFDVGKDEFMKFFPMSNFLPNNDIIESLAVEAKNDVREGMLAVETLYDSGQRYTALMRLMETFALGENEAPVRRLAYEKKKVFHELYRDMSAMKDMGDNRDLAGILEVLERVKLVATDFPYRETMSKVRTAQQGSNLKIMSARASAFAGDTAAAEKSINEAAAIWPLNPELEKFTSEVMDATVGKEKYVKNFNDLHDRADYRGIMREAQEFAIALKDSPEKTKALKEIVNKISQIDILVAQANELHAQGNSYIAWEMLEKAKTLDEDDPVLARAIAALAPHVADYVKILNRAKTAERQKRYSEALNNFLQAQDIFPTSQECRLGIERAAKSALMSIGNN